MQFIKYTFLGLLGITTASSCTDYINEVQPAQSLPGTEIIGATASEQGLTGVLIGAYNNLQDSDFGSNALSLNSTILSDNGVWEGSFPSYRDIYNRQITPNNGETTDMWTAAYTLINQTNLILRGLNESQDPSLTDGIRASLEGQALFLRGLTYFELVRFYGLPYDSGSNTDPGVPIVLEGVLNPEDITFPSRATVQEVYDQAIEDLTAAQGLLDPTSESGFANSVAATAYLAEIAFQQRDYATAATLAGQVIDNPNYMLTTSPVTPFITEGSSEEIFAVESNTQDNPGVNGSLATFHNVLGRGGDVVVSPDLLDNGYYAVIGDGLDEADAEGDTIIDLRVTELVTFSSNGKITTAKYEDVANNGDDNILLRLATYYLMRAEALVRTDGINDESIELLNAIRSRAFVRQRADGAQVPNDVTLYETGDFDDDDALIEAIILERRVELAFEPNRIHDLRRLMRDVRGLPYDDPSLVFPLPQRELDANKNLEQNPGY